jgi:nicotinamidase-related amidase
MDKTAKFFDALSPTSPSHYKPSETALLLLDWHSMFVSKAAGAEVTAALAVTARLRSWAKKHDVEIIHALIDSSRDPYTTCKGGDRLRTILASMKQSGGAAEPSALLPTGDDVGPTENGGEVTFMRTPGHVSALKSPGLLDHLETKNIKSLLLTGLSTSGCVARTAFSATDAEFVVTVISDACAEADQAVHDAMIENVLPSRNFVATAADVQKLFAS